MSGPEQEESPVLARCGMWEIMRPAPAAMPAWSKAERVAAAMNYYHARYAQNVTAYEVEYDWYLRP